MIKRNYLSMLNNNSYVLCKIVNTYFFFYVQFKIEHLFITFRQVETINLIVIITIFYIVYINCLKHLKQNTLNLVHSLKQKGINIKSIV